MPNVTDLLKQDHREVEGLFAQFESSGDASVAERVCDEIDVHARAEEQVVYPVLRDEVSADMADHAEHEHAEARQIIGRIRQTKDPSHLADVMGELKKAIEEHVQEEEGEVFPKMESALSSGRLDQLGGEVQEFKTQS